MKRLILALSFLLSANTTSFAEKVVVVPLGSTTNIMASINWRGEWSGSESYQNGDGVQWEGSSYLCVGAPDCTIIPPDGSWDLMAAAGADGTSTESDPTVPASVKDGISWFEVSNRPAGLDDGDNVGISTESDPTVTESVKDGVSWDEVTGIPAGFADNTDDDSGGDITSVTAGNGLTGGGSTGSVTLSHADTSNQPSVNNSNGIVIQDITLDTSGHLTNMLSTDLDGRYCTEAEANSNYVNVSGDSMMGDLSIVGTLKISPAGGSTITANAMRNINTSAPTSGDITSSGDLYLSNDLEVGSQIYASKELFMNGNSAAGDDGDQTIYFYNGGSRTGESIKWNDFEGRFDLSTHTQINGYLRVDQDVIVTEDVDVAGSIFMGYERVVGSAVAINTNVGNCTILGTSNCYSDIATATCPAGKVVIGGGCDSNLTSTTIIVDNYPSNTTTWHCNAYSSSTNGLLTAYALCSRMGN